MLFCWKKLLCNDKSHNYLVFQLISKYFQIFKGFVDKIFGWKSKGLWEIKIAILAISDKYFSTKLTSIHNTKNTSKIWKKHCLKQD